MGLREIILEQQVKTAKYYFDRADVLMVAISSDETVHDINQVALQILGYTKDEVLGKNWFDNFVEKKNRENTRKLFRDTLSGKMRHVHFETTIHTKQGQSLIFDFHNILTSDGKGTTLGVLSSGSKISQQKKRNETQKQLESRLQATLDYMIEGCQIIDYDWRYIYINEAAAKQGKKPKEELIGFTMMQAYPGIEKTELFNHLNNCMANRVPARIENEFTFPDGSKGWFELRIEPVPEGILIFSVDITKNKANEAELNKYRNRLEEVVAEKTAECGKISTDLHFEVEEHKKDIEALKLRATILDNAMESIFLTNIKGDFAYANKSAQEAYGYTLDELLNKKITALLPNKDAPSAEGLLKHIAEKGQTSLEMIHIDKNSVEMPVKVYANLVKTMHGHYIVFVIRQLHRR
jgi:PAS domain S-box-containing protein